MISKKYGFLLRIRTNTEYELALFELGIALKSSIELLM